MNEYSMRNFKNCKNAEAAFRAFDSLIMNHYNLTLNQLEAPKLYSLSFKELS